MEVVGGVASIISVVTLALQSTKVIYEAVSSINHGSSSIDKLVRATNNLEKLLKAVYRLAVHAQATNNVAEGKLLEDLTPLVDQCTQNLREISPKLGQLQAKSSDRRWQKAKKLAKVYLDTKGVTDIWNTVNHHVELLGSFICNASVDVGLYNAQELHILHNEFLSTSQDHKSLFGHIKEILQDQRAIDRADFDALQAEFRQNSLDARSAGTAQMQGISEMKEWQKQQSRTTAVLGADIQSIKATVRNESDQIITAIRKGIAETETSSSAHFENVGHRNEEVKQDLYSISDRLEGISSMTNEQRTTLQTLISMISGFKLQEHIENRDAHNVTTSNAHPFADDKSEESELPCDTEYDRILSRIINNANKIAIHRYSKDTQLIIEDMGRLLDLVMQRFGTTTPTRDDLARKRKAVCDYHYAELETEVQSMELMSRAKRVLNCTQRAQFSNPDSGPIKESGDLRTSSVRHSETTLTKNFRQKWIPIANLQNVVKSCILGHARLDAVIKNMLLHDTKEQDTEYSEALVAKFIVTPTSAQLSNLQIIIDIASREHQNRAIYFTPTLTIRNMIPDDSKVFRVVKKGSVKKLNRLLNSGAASLGDRDSRGRSLLNFALFKARRKMTSFLIQSGADVDSLEPGLDDIHGLDPIKPMAMIWRAHDRERADEDVRRMDGCYKLLIDAGSDVSSIINMRTGSERYWSAFTLALISCNLVKVKTLVDLGEPFTSLESTGDQDPLGTIPLLFLANIHAGQSPEIYQLWGKTALILSRGARVTARNSTGKTCLHIVLSGHGHDEDGCWCHREAECWQHLSQTRELLILMISAGADVCAVDDYGESVSDVALNSGLNTVWTKALRYCGIDIKDVLARSNFNPACSTAISPEYNEPPTSVRSQVSLTECIERRKVFADLQEEFDRRRKTSPEFSSSEDDDSDDEDSAEELGDDKHGQDGFWAEERFDDGESEDEAISEGSNEEAEANEQGATAENGARQIKHEGGIFNEKAKME